MSSAIANCNINADIPEQRGEMTFDIRAKILKNCEKMNSKEVQQVIAIIRKSMPSIGTDGGEIELDINALDNTTLWRLCDFFAKRPWSTNNHELFPDAARARAVELLLVGHHLSREPQFEGEAQAVVDVWVEHVMPFAVERDHITLAPPTQRSSPRR